MDERARNQLALLEDLYGKDQFQKITGKHLSGNLSIAKITWLREMEPEIFQRTFKYLDVQSFLVYQMTGKFCTSWGSADPMGLFDMLKRRWSDDLLQNLDLTTDQFPQTVPPGKVIGTIIQKVSEICGLPKDLPVIAGTGDGQAAGIGSMVTNPGTAYLSLGTSVVSGYFSSTYQVSDKFRTMFGGIEDTYLLETVILGGTYTISWLLDKVLHGNTLGLDISIEKLEKAAKGVPAGADGLMMVPYWNSAMNPYWDPDASGIIIGLRGIHGPEHLFRAILEGIAFEQRLHTIGVKNVLDIDVDYYVVTGGGSKSDLWCQIIADVTGIPVRRTLEKEITALGAGILVAVALGNFPDIDTAVHTMVHLEAQEFHPKKENHQLYSKLFENVYINLYPSLKNSLKQLAAC
jgi:xylulokinase